MILSEVLSDVIIDMLILGEKILTAKAPPHILFKNLHEHE